MAAKRWTQAAMRQVATEERTEQRLGERDRLDPYAIAETHGVDVYPIDELRGEHCSDAAVEHFLSARRVAWSAALVPVGSARFILDNTGHTVQRRRASIAHELGHFLLEHDFDDVLLTDDGCRQFDPVQEKQAKYFSGELLVPDKAAQKAAFWDWTDDQVADHFHVSVPFARWRMNSARVVARRALRRQAGR